MCSAILQSFMMSSATVYAMGHRDWKTLFDTNLASTAARRPSKTTGPEQGDDLCFLNFTLWRQVFPATDENIPHVRLVHVCPFSVWISNTTILSGYGFSTVLIAVSFVQGSARVDVTTARRNVQFFGGNNDVPACQLMCPAAGQTGQTFVNRVGVTWQFSIIATLCRERC